MVRSRDPAEERVDDPVVDAPDPELLRADPKVDASVDVLDLTELDPDRVRRSGLVIPPGSDEPPPQHGIVLAVGAGLDVRLSSVRLLRRVPAINPFTQQVTDVPAQSHFDYPSSHGRHKLSR